MAGEPGIEWLLCEIAVFVHSQSFKREFFVNEIFSLFKYLSPPWIGGINWSVLNQNKIWEKINRPRNKLSGSQGPAAALVFPPLPLFLSIPSLLPLLCSLIRCCQEDVPSVPVRGPLTHPHKILSYSCFEFQISLLPLLSVSSFSSQPLVTMWRLLLISSVLSWFWSSSPKACNWKC